MDEQAEYSILSKAAYDFFHGGEALAQTIGSLIIIYGVFRIGMAMFFSAFDEQVFLFESILAWGIGFLYVIGGVFTLLGYRNGIFWTLATLIFSGSLSVMYHDEWSPLSAVSYTHLTLPTKA